jgi:hypothetical protein
MKRVFETIASAYKAQQAAEILPNPPPFNYYAVLGKGNIIYRKADKILHEILPKNYTRTINIHLISLHCIAIFKKFINNIM